MNRSFPNLCIAATAFALFLIPTRSGAASGDLYLSDFAEGTIFKFTPTGTKSTFASGLHPLGLAFDTAGNLFVADYNSLGSPATHNDGHVFKFTPSGTKTTFASGLRPIALAFDAKGNLFVTDLGGDPGNNSGSILKFSRSGSRSVFALGLSGLLSGMAFNGKGNLFVGDSNRILIFPPNFAVGDMSETFAEATAINLALDAKGNLFAATNLNATILRITPTGQMTTFTSIDSAPLNGVFGLAFDGKGNLFVTDGGNGSANSGRILKFTSAGGSAFGFFATGLNSPTFLAFQPATEELLNISSRGVVQTGDNVLIGGFIVGGNALVNNTVVVRAIGPSLARAGVAHPLSDPTLELHNASGAIIASNNNWRDNQQAQIQATGLAPTDARESAILRTLPAGSYTAIVRGVGNATGVALVEVYGLQ